MKNNKEALSQIDDTHRDETHTKYNKKRKEMKEKLSPTLCTSKAPQHTLAINLLY